MAWEVSETIGAGKTHATIALFESDHDGDATSDGTNCEGKCTGDCTGGNTYFAGWQTGMDDDTRIVIKADTGQEADGTDGAGAYIDDSVLFSENTNAIFFDLRNMEVSGSYSALVHIDTAPSGAASEFRFTKCLMRDISGNDGFVHCHDPSVAINIYVGGCLIKGNTGNWGEGLYFSGANTTATLVNCTIAEITGTGSVGIQETNSATVTAKNCAAVNCTDDIAAGVATTTCGSEEGDAEFTITNTDGDDFTEPSTDDYTIYSGGGSDLDGSGTAEAGSWFTTLCATDFAGTAWKNPPSVGCFELAAAGGLSIPVAMQNIRGGFNPIAMRGGFINAN